MSATERALKSGYFAYFCALGVFQPYWPVVLAARGFLPARIGLLMAAVSGIRVVAPLLQERLARRLGDRTRALVATAAMAALLVPAMASAGGLPATLCALAAFGACLNGLMPAYDAIAVDLLAPDGHRYGRVRLWGSIGYIAASFAAGALVAQLGVGVIPIALGLCLAATALVCRTLPTQPGAVAVAARAPAPGRPRAAGYWLLVVCFLQLASFGGYYSFYSLYLTHHGYGESAIGLYWSLGVVAEIVVFYVAAPLLRRVSLVVLLEWALAGTVLRWIALALWPADPMAMAAAQLLHLAGFGLFHVVCVLLAPRLLGVGSARALALVSSVGWGAGGVAGSLLAGWVWQVLGPQAVYGVAAALAAAAFVVTECCLRQRGADHAAPLALPAEGVRG